MKRLFTWVFLLCWAMPVFAQWEDTHGPDNFSITRMASISDSIFCLNGSKIYVSKDAPVSWQAYMNGIPSEVEILELRKNANLLIAIGNDQPYFLLKGSNTWKSITQGLPKVGEYATLYTFDNEHIFIEFYIENNYFVYKLDWAKEAWVALPTLENTYKLAFAYDPANGFLAAYDREDADGNYEIYLANSKEGINWDVKVVTEADSLDFAYVAYHDSLLFASNYDAELLQSSDFGLSWTKLTPNVELFSASRFHSEGKSLFLVTSGGIHLSKDRGQSFETVVEDFFLRASSPVQFSENAVYYVSFGIPGLALVEDGFWFQTDLYFPAHFLARNYLLTDEKVFSYGVGGCLDLTALDDEENLFATTNLPTTNLFTDQVEKTGKELFATAQDGLYRYDLGTKEWEVAMGNLDFPILPETPVFAAKGDTSLMASFLGIHKWESATKQWQLLEDAPSVFSGASLKANEHYFYGLIDDELYLWKGGQNEWESVELPEIDFFDSPLDVEFKGDTLFYVDDTQVQYSRDLGQSWTNVPHNLFSFSDSKFAKVGTKLFIIINGTFGDSELLEVNGKGVTEKEFSIANAAGDELLVDHIFAIDDLLFARTYDYNLENYLLYVSKNFGASWEKVNLPTGLEYITDGSSIGDLLYFATEKGVWSVAKSALGLLTSDKPVQNIKLASFFPNPSSGKFTLQTSLTELGTKPVQINVFNTFGQKIRSYTTPLNGSTLELDLSDVQNGMYFIYLQAGTKAWKSQVIKTN